MKLLSAVLETDNKWITLIGNLLGIFQDFGYDIKMYIKNIFSKYNWNNMRKFLNYIMYV